MNRFFDDFENHANFDTLVIDIEDYCSIDYDSSFAPSFLQRWAEFQDTMGITTIDILRLFLFLSVSLFLCTAVLLQGTLLELGMVRCRRTLCRWNALLDNSCRRLTLT